MPHRNRGKRATQHDIELGHAFQQLAARGG
jgi:hypothetical protein